MLTIVGFFASFVAPEKTGTVSWHGSCCVPLPNRASPFRFGAGRWASRICGAMKHKNSHLLVGYWSRLRNGRDVPDQTDIDPAPSSACFLYIHSGLRESFTSHLPSCRHRAVRAVRFRTQGHRLSRPLGSPIGPVAGLAAETGAAFCASRSACPPSPRPPTTAWSSWRRS